MSEASVTPTCIDIDISRTATRTFRISTTGTTIDISRGTARETGAIAPTETPDARDLDASDPGRIGAVLGRGIRSVIREWRTDEVVKVPEPSTPLAWMAEELRLADSAARAGAPVPDGRYLVEIEGRPALACALIEGRSMWEELRSRPDCAEQLGHQLAELQLLLFGLTPSYELPDQRDRIASKIYGAARRHGHDLLAALALMDELLCETGPMVLCHGDLHPSNVMLSPSGPVIVDWFDACRGGATAEVARTSLILDAPEFLHGEERPSDEVIAAIARLREVYLDVVCAATDTIRADLERWELVQRVARLHEGFGIARIDIVRQALAELVRAQGT